MRAFRLKIRSLMVLVGIAAALCGAVEMRRRSQTLRERAAYHFAAGHQLEMDCRSFICGFGMSPERLAEIARQRADKQKLLMAAAEYHRVLERKYRSAAARPWLPIESDPPAPPEGNPKLVSADDY
jgi:hypothetical protein